MKKLLIAVMLSMVILTACGNHNDAKNTPASQGEVMVSKGYSLSQFGLGLEEQNIMYEKTCAYSKEVSVNGNYTEIYGKTSGDPVPAAAVQCFYKKDLRNGGIYINGRTFSAEDLADHVLYEDDSIIVYNISYYVYPTTLEQRTAAAVNGQQIEGMIAQLSQFIGKNKTGHQLPVPPKKVNTVSKVIVSF